MIKELSAITLRPLHLSERQMELTSLHLGCVHLSCQLMPQMITVLTKYFPQQPCSVLFQRRESSQDLEATLANISTDNLCTYQMPNDFIYHQAISENFV